MLKALAIIGLVVVVLIAGVAIYAATKPDSFRVERSIAIKAPPEKLHALVNDLRVWATWSPYEKKDPNMKRSFGATTSGKGATYAWEGDKNVGHGRMEIVEVATPSKVAIKLDFLKPFEAHNIAEFTFVPRGDSTTVTWAIYGPSPYVSKVMSTFIDMDKMIGNDFEAGLQTLKALAEK